MEWISAEDRLPEAETPVLVLCRARYDTPFVGARYWEICNPMTEPYFEDFLYWDNCQDDGQGIDDSDVTHWMPLPPPPTKVTPEDT